jgi:hypothetical protein
MKPMDENLYKPPRETNEVASTARQRPSVGRFLGFGLVVSRTSDISHDFIFVPPVVPGAGSVRCRLSVTAAPHPFVTSTPGLG